MTAAVVTLGAIAAALPALWAWTATRSLNQTLAFAAQLDALSALRGLAPIGLGAVFFGTAIGGMLFSLSMWPMTRRGGTIHSTTLGQSLATAAIAVALAFGLGVTSMLLPWELAAAAGAWSVFMLALAPAGAYYALRDQKRIWGRTVRGIVGVVAMGIVLSALLGLAQSLRPVPLVSLTFEGGDAQVVYLVHSEGGVTWFLRPTGSNAIPAADRLVMDSDTRPITELHVCRVAPTYGKYLCDLP